MERVRSKLGSIIGVFSGTDTNVYLHLGNSRSNGDMQHFLT